MMREVSHVCEPLHKKKKKQSAYAITKMQISCAVTAQLIIAFVFAIQITYNPTSSYPNCRAAEAHMTG